MAVALALVLWDTWEMHYEIPDWEPAFASTSADGRFTVSVYYTSGIIPLPDWLNPRRNNGTVVLRDNRTGKVLQRAKVDYVAHDTPHIEWFPERNKVGAVSLDIWDLPTE